jgi:hypothetical protein
VSAIAPFPTPAQQPSGPTDLEAEAALLGAFLIENGTLDDLALPLSPEHFAEPLHSRIFATIVDQRGAGRAVTPATLKPLLEGEPALRELGGGRYLFDLTATGSGLLAVRELAEQVIDLADRRRRLEYLQEQARLARDLTEPLGELAPPLASWRSPLAPLDLTALAEIDPQPKKFIIPRLAPAGETTLFTGAGAVGKSLLAQQLATALAAGRDTLGLTLRQAPAIYLTAEDDAEQLHWRQKHLCSALGVPMVSLAGRLHLITRRGEPSSFLALVGEAGFEPSALYRQLERLMKASGVRALFLDNVAHLFPGDENDRSDVTAFVNLLNRLAGETQAAIVLLGHPNKAGDTYSGSTAWLNAVRSQISMERPKGSEHDPDLRAVHVGKPNYAQAGEALRCRWLDWAFIRDEDLPADERDKLAETIGASSENTAFLDCLRARAAQGAGRSVGPKPGPSYAPAQFEGMPQAKGHDRHALKRAMERLLTIGRIECVTVENRQKGREVTILQEAPEASPNSFPNPSRTLFPNVPEPAPNAARSVPAHTPPPTGEGDGAPAGARPSTRGEGSRQQSDHQARPAQPSSRKDLADGR